MAGRFGSALRGLHDKSKATAKPLLDILLKNGLIPASMESHFTGLRAAMESGLPTIRNTEVLRWGSFFRSVRNFVEYPGQYLCKVSQMLIAKRILGTK